MGGHFTSMPLHNFTKVDINKEQQRRARHDTRLIPPDGKAAGRGSPTSAARREQCLDNTQPTTPPTDATANSSSTNTHHAPGAEGQQTQSITSFP
jgi:hypothetical protein